MTQHLDVRRLAAFAFAAVSMIAAAPDASAARPGATAYYPAWGFGTIYGALIAALMLVTYVPSFSLALPRLFMGYAH